MADVAIYTILNLLTMYMHSTVFISISGTGIKEPWNFFYKSVVTFSKERWRYKDFVSGIGGFFF